MSNKIKCRKWKGRRKPVILIISFSASSDFYPYVCNSFFFKKKNFSFKNKTKVESIWSFKGLLLIWVDFRYLNLKFYVQLGYLYNIYKWFDISAFYSIYMLSFLWYIVWRFWYVCVNGIKDRETRVFFCSCSLLLLIVKFIISSSLLCVWIYCWKWWKIVFHTAYHVLCLGNDEQI